MFLLLALGTTALFLWGVRGPFAVGWRELARPLVADYVDRLAAEIGTPPDIDRAQAMTRRLPLSVRIDGPVVNGSSHAALRPAGRAASTTTTTTTTAMPPTSAGTACSAAAPPMATTSASVRGIGAGTITPPG